jgi:phage shock protein PspC (stress-responsive transcriptional regulator)
MNRHLYRCRHDRRVAGVAAGVAEYFGLDVTLVRVVWFVSMFFGLFTLVVYIGLAIIIPLEPLTADEAAHAETLAAAGDVGHRHVERRSGVVTTWIGLGLVLLGTLALADVVIPGMSWRYLWPVFIVGLGGLLLAGSLRRETAPFVAAPGTSPNAGPPPTGAPSATAAEETTPD